MFGLTCTPLCCWQTVSFKWVNLTVFRFSSLRHTTVQVQLTWHNKREASLLWLLSHAKKRDGKLQISYIWCSLLLKTIWAQRSRKDPVNCRTSSMNFKANIHFQTHGTGWRLLKCQHARRMAGRHLFILDNTLKEMAFQCGRYCPFLCCFFKGREREWMQRISEEVSFL